MHVKFKPQREMTREGSKTKQKKTKKKNPKSKIQTAFTCRVLEFENSKTEQNKNRRELPHMRKPLTPSLLQETQKQGGKKETQNHKTNQDPEFRGKKERERR